MSTISSINFGNYDPTEDPFKRSTNNTVSVSQYYNSRVTSHSEYSRCKNDFYSIVDYLKPTEKNKKCLTDIINEFNSTILQTDPHRFEQSILTIKFKKAHVGTLKAELLINKKISILRDLKFVCNLKNFDTIYTINGKNFVKKDPNGQKPDKVITAGHFLDRIVNTLINHGTREHCVIGINFLTNSSKLFPLELQDKISSSIMNIKSVF